MALQYRILICYVRLYPHMVYFAIFQESTHKMLISNFTNYTGMQQPEPVIYFSSVFYLQNSNSKEVVSFFMYSPATSPNTTYIGPPTSLCHMRIFSLAP